MLVDLILHLLSSSSLYVLCRSFFNLCILFGVRFCFVSVTFILVASTESLSLCAGQKLIIRVAANLLAICIAISTSSLVLETVSLYYMNTLWLDLTDSG